MMVDNISLNLYIENRRTLEGFWAGFFCYSNYTLQKKII